ncbi:MAG: FAD-binding domain-containing protein [Candidatus Kapaibacteriales bacterium]
MELEFPTAYEKILERIEKIDPVLYGKTRNYVDGAVTYLSPYISRGVISTKQVLDRMLAKGYKLYQMESFVKELSWRDYFQRVAQVKDVNKDIKQVQKPILNYQIPAAIVNASTGIHAIDTAVKQLYNSGYMHNHVRMYTASIICNIAKSHWLHPAKWMYYHLLDGDWASNACSWQWVAGANSSKKYYANQENINKYTKTNQKNTFLDHSYEDLIHMSVPQQLKDLQKLTLVTNLPRSQPLQIDANLPTFIYNYYNLDPLWHSQEKGNRILLLDPDFFAAYPVSDKCISFMLELSKNIPGIQVYTGSFQSLLEHYPIKNIFFKEHPLNSGYKGTEESRDWIAAEVIGYFPSFFAYWKKVENHLQKLN